VNLENS